MAYNSFAVSRGCGYRKVLGFIIKLADGKLKEVCPNMTREQRIILAQKEPLFTACKELRDPTEKELQKVSGRFLNEGDNYD